MNSLFPTLNKRLIFIIPILVLLVLVTGRLLKGGCDFSYFIVAGTDFVDPSKTPAPIIVQPGQGYDGQFFYRYALNPFDFSNDQQGIHVDLPPYRLQRIAYPLSAWLLSFGGNPYLVPVSLVLVNILTFIGIIFYTRKFIRLCGASSVYAYFPMLLCGLYMSLARDLSEVTELFFFTAAVYYLFNRSFAMFAFFAALTLLTRETSLVALLPLALYSSVRNIKSKTNTINLFWMGIPFLVFFLWKLFVIQQTGSNQLVSATHNLGIPFVGIAEGFRANFDFSTTKNTGQFIFWMLYFLWQLAFLYLVLKSIFNHWNDNNELMKPLVLVFFVWLLFATCFSAAVYSDDWSFVRVFSLWNMTGMLLLMVCRKEFSNWFRLFSFALVLFTIFRLIIRV